MAEREPWYLLPEPHTDVSVKVVFYRESDDTFCIAYRGKPATLIASGAVPEVALQPYNRSVPRVDEDGDACRIWSGSLKLGRCIEICRHKSPEGAAKLPGVTSGMLRHARKAATRSSPVTEVDVPLNAEERPRYFTASQNSRVPYGWRERGRGSGYGIGMIEGFICDPRSRSEGALALIREFMSLVDSSDDVYELLQLANSDHAPLEDAVRMLRAFHRAARSTPQIAATKNVASRQMSAIALRLVVDNTRPLRAAQEVDHV